MLASDTYAGMGVRPHAIPPPFAPRYYGAVFKEFDSDRGMRRKRKARRGSNEQADTWQFKGGPVRSRDTFSMFVALPVLLTSKARHDCRRATAAATRCGAATVTAKSWWSATTAA